jgi:hypothetical protein
VLFGVISGDTNVIIIEMVIAAAFGAVAIWGYYYTLGIVGVGLIAHGVFDALHDRLLLNTGVPDWWAMFCLAVDVVLGLWLLILMRRRREQFT